MHIGAGASRSGRRAAHLVLDSSVTSVVQRAATMAGAMTIPIKARAIKKSCMIEVSIRHRAVLQPRPAKASASLLPPDEEETPQRESPRLKPKPENSSAADLPMHHRQDERNLEIPRNVYRGCRSVSSPVTLESNEGHETSRHERRSSVGDGRAQRSRSIRPEMAVIAPISALTIAISGPATPDSRVE